VTVLTTANQLTLLRMLLIPAFVILLVYEQEGWALTIFMIAGVTDGLDGWFARRGQKTSLGAFLDPMADKLLLVTTFIVLTLPGIGLINRIPLWLTILVISRDVVIVLTVAIVTIAVGRRQFRPSIYGKAATAIYILTCVVVMFFNFLERPSVLVPVCVYLSLAATLVSGVHYIMHVARIINQPQASPTPR
jgi:cardiolipin synthase (CMP-forming)